MVLSDGRSTERSHADALIQSSPLERAGENLEDVQSQVRDALRSAEHASDPDDSERAAETDQETAVRLTTLAAAGHALGKYASADALYRRALSIYERILPPNHLTTAEACEALAETCAARGRVAEAVSLCDRSLSIRETALGADDPSVQRALARIADLQLEAQEDTRFATPPRSAPALRSSLPVEAPTSERTSIADASPLPKVFMPEWAPPDVTEDRVPWHSALAKVGEVRSSRAKVVVAGVVLVVAGVAIASQFGDDRSKYLLDQQPGASWPERTPTTATTIPVVTRLDSLPIASARRVLDTLPPRVAPPSVVARERPLQPVPAPRVTVAQTPARVADSVAARAVAPAVVAASEIRPTIPPNGPTSPTSPMLIGAAPQPAYPVALRDQRIEGDVVVQFVVDETGRPDVSSTTVVRSPHVLLTNAVLAILPQLRFEPARTAPPQSIPRPETVRRVFTFRAPRP